MTSTQLLSIASEIYTRVKFYTDSGNKELDEADQAAIMQIVGVMLMNKTTVDDGEG